MRRLAAGLGAVWLALAAAASADAGRSGLGLAPPALEIRISRDGFEPSEIRLHREETVRLAIRSEDGEHCFAVDEFRIEKRVRPGQATRVEFTPDRVGRFVYYCCLEPDSVKLKGTLIVSE